MSHAPRRTPVTELVSNAHLQSLEAKPSPGGPSDSSFSKQDGQGHPLAHSVGSRQEDGVKAADANSVLTLRDATGLEPHQRFALEKLGVGDFELLRLVLQGGSVIDWRRLHFGTREEVDNFLKLLLFDPDLPADRQRMQAILDQAVSYLRRTFRYKVPEEVAKPREIHDLFLLASGAAGPERLRRIACVVLKVMHTVHHIEARELLARTRVSEFEIEQMVDARVREALDKISDEYGITVAEFQGSAKSRDSIITKLIAKKESLAAQIYDRLRYRIVVPEPEDLVPLVLALAHELFPFNYVVPGQTQNTLISFSDVLAAHPKRELLSEKLLEGNGSSPLRAHEINEFSSRDYRILNFIVDLPMRIDATALAARKDRDVDLGQIVFTPVELQVLDSATQLANESGDSAHPRYKRRQLRRVLSRLLKGLGTGRSSERRRASRSQGDAKKRGRRSNSPEGSPLKLVTEQGVSSAGSQHLTATSKNQVETSERSAGSSEQLQASGTSERSLRSSENLGGSFEHSGGSLGRAARSPGKGSPGKVGPSFEQSGGSSGQAASSSGKVWGSFEHSGASSEHSERDFKKSAESAGPQLKDSPGPRTEARSDSMLQSKSMLQSDSMLKQASSREKEASVQRSASEQSQREQLFEKDESSRQTLEDAQTLFRHSESQNDSTES